MIDDRGKISFANRRLASLLGCREEDLAGVPLTSFVSIGDAWPDEAAFLREIRKGPLQRLEFSYRRTDGSLFPAETNCSWLTDTGGRRRGVLGLCTDITDRKVAETAELEQAERLSLLHRIAGQLLGTPDPQRVIDGLAHEMLERLDCQVFFNYLLEPEDGRLHRNAFAGIPVEEAAEITLLELGTAVCGYVAASGCRMVAENIQDNPQEISALVRSYGIRAYACHPLMATNGRVIGTLSFGTRSRDRFSEDDLLIMSTVTDYVAIAMERMQSYREQQRLLEEVNRRAEDIKAFVQMVSHDLRAPLTVANGHAGLLTRSLEQDDDAMAHIHAEAIGRSVRRMDAMIDDLVQVARLEGNQGKVNLQPLGLRSYLPGFLARNAGIIDIDRILVEIEDALPPVLGDPDRLERILTNLLTNAQKYSASQTPIHIRLRRAGEEVTVSISDQGQGISPRDLPHIFERFYKPESNLRSDSLGLGLYIARLLVEDHGGRIEAESEPGRGSTFTFALRLADNAEARASLSVTADSQEISSPSEE